MEVSALCRSVLVWSAGRPSVGLTRPFNHSCATEHLCPPLPLFFPVRKGPVSTQQGSLVLIGSGPVLLALHSRDPVRCQRLNLGQPCAGPMPSLLFSCPVHGCFFVESAEPACAHLYSCSSPSWPQTGLAGLVSPGATTCMGAHSWLLRGPKGVSGLSRLDTAHPLLVLGNAGVGVLFVLLSWWRFLLEEQ